MDERLYLAALTGNVDDLQDMLYEDPLILHSVSLASAETPLHVACISGHLSFVKEMIRLKPEFARELNPKGFNPIHLASANGCVDIVKALLMVNQDNSRLKSRDRRTPLHYAAIKGRVDVISVLISSCGESIEDVTIRGETALHLSVKNYQFEAFRLMVEMVRQLGKEEVLNMKDQEGNNILHLATSTKQREVIELLLDQDLSPAMEVNTMNNNNLTALDLLLLIPGEPSDRDIEEILRNAGATRATPLHPNTNPIPENNSNNNQSSSVRRTNKSPLDRLVEFFKFQTGRDSPSEARDAMLVIAILMTTATYQAGLSPPGGVWQDNGNPNDKIKGSKNSAGISILSTKDAVSYGLFIFFNSAGFYVSLFMIRVLTSGFPLRLELEICIGAMALTYNIAMLSITPRGKLWIVFQVFVALIPLAIPFIIRWIRTVYEKKELWKSLSSKFSFTRAQPSQINPSSI